MVNNFWMNLIFKNTNMVLFTPTSLNWWPDLCLKVTQKLGRPSSYLAIS